MWSQVGFAFRSVEHALTIIVRNLESFSGLAAETERLDALAAGMPPCRHPQTLSTTPVLGLSILHYSNAIGQLRKCTSSTQQALMAYLL